MARLTAYSIVLFFVCLNVSLYALNESGVVGDIGQSPYSSPSGIIGNLAHVDINGTTLFMGITSLAVTVIFGLLTQNLVLGGTLGLILFAINLFSPVASWVIFGFPKFLVQLGVPSWMVTGIEALMSVVWFWFFLGFVTQRTVET